MSLVGSETRHKYSGKRYETSTMVRGFRKRRKVYGVEEIAQALYPLAKRFGIGDAYLYGSYARGTADKDSDVDIIIDRGRMTTYFQLMELEDNLSDILGKNVEIVTFGSGERFISAIEKDLVLIYEDGS